MAHITFTGNLGKDPELRRTSDGKAWVSLSVAWSERRKDKLGSWEDGPTEWVNVVANGSLAENIATSLTKGATVEVTGRIAPREWQGQQGPQKYLHVQADTVAPSLRFQQATVSRGQTNQGLPQTGWHNTPQVGLGGGAQDEEQPYF